MKNYFVKANRNFTDKEENAYRNAGDAFYCTEERYNYLVSCNNAVELVELPKMEEEIEEIKPKKVSKKKNK